MPLATAFIYRPSFGGVSWPLGVLKDTGGTVVELPVWCPYVGAWPIENLKISKCAHTPLSDIEATWTVIKVNMIKMVVSPLCFHRIQLPIVTATVIFSGGVSWWCYLVVILQISMSCSFLWIVYKFLNPSWPNSFVFHILRKAISLDLNKYSNLH